MEKRVKWSGHSSAFPLTTVRERDGKRGRNDKIQEIKIRENEKKKKQFPP
jgi:hypothetical protein